MADESKIARIVREHVQRYVTNALYGDADTVREQMVDALVAALEAHAKGVAANGIALGASAYSDEAWLLLEKERDDWKAKAEALGETAARNFVDAVNAQELAEANAALARRCAEAVARWDAFAGLSESRPCGDARRESVAASVAVFAALGREEKAG